MGPSSPAVVAAAAAATALLLLSCTSAPRLLPFSTFSVLRSQAPPSVLPLTLPVAAALALVLLICVLAAGSGIGGGAALVPVFLIAGFQATPSHAVALSNLTILGASLAAFAVNAARRRPGPACLPLIDWDVVLLMEPATIVGAVGGAFINRVLPPWVTLGGLAAVLAFVTHNVAGRARSQWVAESALADLRRGGGGGAAAGTARGVVADSLRARLLAGLEAGGGGDGPSGSGPDAPPKPVPGGEDGPPPPRPPPPSTRPPAVPAGTFAALFALFAIVAASDFFKARVECGSAAYWTAALAVVPPALAVTAYARSAALGHAAHPEDGLAWTPARTLLFPAVSSLAGLFAGLFGVGGGILKAPVLLALGVDPAVASATSMTMILFTSASASTVYLGFGTPRDWSIAVFGIGVVASALGVLGLARAVDAAGRKSLVTIAMAATLGVSLLASGWQAGAVTAAAARAGELGRHGSLCRRV